MFLDHATTAVDKLVTSKSNAVSTAAPGDAGTPRVSAGQLRVKFQKDGSAVVETLPAQPPAGAGVSGLATAQPMPATASPAPPKRKKHAKAPEPTQQATPAPAPAQAATPAPAPAQAPAQAATPSPAAAATALAARIEGLAQELASRLNDVSALAGQVSSAAGSIAAQQAPVHQAPAQVNPSVAGSPSTAPAAAAPTAPDPAVLEQLKTEVQNHLAEAVSAGTGVDLVKKLVSTVLASAGIAPAANAGASDSAAAKPPPNCP